MQYCSELRTAAGVDRADGRDAVASTVFGSCACGTADSCASRDCEGGPIRPFEPRRLCVDVRDLTPEALRGAAGSELIVLCNHMCGSAMDVAIVASRASLGGLEALDRR